jgi:hypothetical protein
MRSKLRRGLEAACLLTLAACATPEQYPRSPFVKQILKPREGHTGLTNRACEVYDPKSGACSTWKVLDYAFEDEAFRKQANQLNFICLVGGKRYKICLDKPGLCRITYTKKCTLGMFCKTERHEDSLPASGYQFLLDSDTVCFSQTEYDLQGW